MSAVCNGLRPSLTGCSSEVKSIITNCWDGDVSSRPCLYFYFINLLHKNDMMYVFLNKQHSIMLC